MGVGGKGEGVGGMEVWGGGQGGKCGFRRHQHITWAGDKQTADKRIRTRAKLLTRVYTDELTWDA